MKTKLFVTVLLSCCIVGLNSFATKYEHNQEIIDRMVEYNQVPGLNFSIIYENGTQHNYSSGYADTLNKIALKPEHVLFSGSVGKTYAVAVLMQLVDEGKVDLRKPFMNYFPGHEWLSNIPNIDKISIEMLLSHTSGLPRYIENEKVWKTLKDNPDKVWSYKERLAYVFDMEPIHKPGKGWSYSDTNYLLIGMLIEKVTGSNYYDEVKTRILNPAELHETHPSLKRDIPNLAVGYSHLGDFFNMPGTVVENGKYVFNPQMEWTGGGFASTTPDLARWAKLYFEGNFFSNALLQKIVTPTQHGSEIGGGMACGMGSFIFDTSLGAAYGHTGFVPGFNTIFAYFPEQKIAVAMQINCDYSKGKMGLMEYVETILNNLSI